MEAKSAAHGRWGWNVKLLAGLGVLGMVGGGLYATDALTAGTVYDKAYKQAYAELATMPLQPVASAANHASGSTLVERGAGTIGWRVNVGSMEVGRFTVRLSPVGADRTRVLVDFAPTASAGGPNPVLESDLMTDFARLAMIEQVDARLENRAPDMREIHMAAARHIQAHPEQVQQFGLAVQAQFRQVDQMLRANDTGKWEEMLGDIEASYGPPPKLEDATRPAVVFPEK